MTVSIPLLAIMAIAVYVVYRYMGLKVWHAVLCLIVGFLLGITVYADSANRAGSSGGLIRLTT